MSHVCRTCLNVIENGSQLFSLEINEPAYDRLQIKTKLETCVPEIILHRVRNSVICSYCFYALNAAYDFKTRCLQTETRIFEFIRRETVDSIDLSHYIKRNPNIMPPGCDSLNQRNMMMGRNRPMLLSPPPQLPPLVLQQMPPLTVTQSLPPPLHPLGPPRMLPPQPHPLLPFAPRSLPPFPQSMTHQPHQPHPPHHPPPPPPNHHHSRLLSGLLTQPSQLRPQLNHNMYNPEPPPMRYLSAPNENVFVLPPDSMIKCPVCQHPFPSNDLLREHMSCHANPPEGLHCSMCNFQTNSTSALDDHLKSHNELAGSEQYCRVETTYSCSSCNFTTADKAAYKEHKGTHASDQLHQCGLCNFNSTHSSSLRRHMKVHMGDRPYRCNKCRFGAADEAALQIHLQIHSKDREINCSECPFTTTKKSKLRHHIMRVHPDKLQSFLESSDDHITQKRQSVGLDKADPFKVSLADIHSILQDEDDSSNSNPLGGNGLDDVDGGPQDVDPFMVTVDDIQNVLQGKSVELELEEMCVVENGGECILMDNGDAKGQTCLKFYRCSVCRQAFKFQYQLRRHMNVHIVNNKAPLKCSKCDFRTMTKSQFMVHMKLHSGGKIFRCDQCKYVTVSWSNFQKHNKIHTGDRQFKCTGCDYQTTKNAALRHHMASVHTGIDLLRCADCPFSTDNEEALLSHIELHSMGNHFIDNVTSSSFIEDTINSITNHFLQDGAPDSEDVVPENADAQDEDEDLVADLDPNPNMTIDDFLETSNQNNDMVVVPTDESAHQDLGVNGLVPHPSENDVSHGRLTDGHNPDTPTDDFGHNNHQTVTVVDDDRILDSSTGVLSDKTIGNNVTHGNIEDGTTPGLSTDGFVPLSMGNDLNHGLVGDDYIPKTSTDDFGSINHQTRTVVGGDNILDRSTGDFDDHGREMVAVGVVQGTSSKEGRILHADDEVSTEHQVI